MIRRSQFVISLAIGVMAYGQTAPPEAKSAKFEVASIKPSDPAVRGFRVQSAPGGRYTASGVTVKFLIQSAYGVRDFQILNAPAWIGTQRYDINAKGEESTANDENVMSQRLQDLLADRFQLKLAQETRELPIYNLTLAKGGSKMQESTVDEGHRSMSMGRGRIVFKGSDMAALVVQLSQQLGRTVVDKTGLTANYDFTLNWTPETPAGPDGPKDPPGADPNGPTLFTALQETLGLKLESAKGPVQVLVIGSVEKPAEN
jgi:uncharacterized protein (TIGR03435 family)